MDLTTGMTASVVKARTFFVAPRSGPHTFMIAGDDYLQLNATYLDVRPACCWGCARAAGAVLACGVCAACSNAA
jgi:hypothetical protein